MVGNEHDVHIDHKSSIEFDVKLLSVLFLFCGWYNESLFQWVWLWNFDYKQCAIQKKKVQKIDSHFQMGYYFYILVFFDKLVSIIDWFNFWFQHFFIFERCELCFNRLVFTFHSWKRICSNGRNFRNVQNFFGKIFKTLLHQASKIKINQVLE